MDLEFNKLAIHGRNRGLRRGTAIGCSALILTLAASCHASTLLSNGSFELLTDGPGQLGYNTNATDWTTSGYNFVFASGTADQGGVTGQDGDLQLWGPQNGSANGLPASSPDGGNFVAADGAYKVGAISQTVNGLTPGDDYTVGFWWAGAQQSGFTGPNTEQWQVSLGSQTLDTAVVDNASHGFTGWQYETMTFTATSATEVLSFLAIGTPSGQPPFSLLDGVSLNAAAPEPSEFALTIGGLLGILAAKKFRRPTRRPGPRP
jgi:hypothetical protein